MKTYIYFHICCINNWISIVDQLYTNIKKSGLYDIVDEIRCGVLGNCDLSIELFNDPKVKIVAQSLDIGLYETISVNKLHEDALSEDFYALYIHSKGVRYNGTRPNVIDWVNFLTYFNIYKHKECIELLKNTCECVGVNLVAVPTVHYSGNFWWSKSSYIKTLKPCYYDNYNAPEFWITSGSGHFVTLWNSNIDQYHHPYPYTEYINKDIEVKGIRK